MQRLVIATGNPGKLREFAALLAPLGFEAVGQRALDIDDADEPHLTFVENALAKARHASRAAGVPALADDSGLCVDALGGLPGVRSARYADLGGDATREARDRANNARLIAALHERTVGASSPAVRDAAFVSCLVYVRHADDPEPVIAHGRWRGLVVDDARGTGGFGYDPHFLVSGLGLTAAELDPATKNRISHRAIAMRILGDALRSRGDPSATRR